MFSSDLFVLDTLESNGTGILSRLPFEYASMRIVDDQGVAVRMRPFIYEIFMQRIHDSAKPVTVECNLKRLQAIESVLDDLKRTGIFKAALVRFKNRGRHNELHVTVKRKSAYYFSVQQTFNTEGNVILAYSGGLRNLCGMLDVLSFNHEKSIQKDKLAQASFNWAFPFLQGGATLDLGFHAGSSSLDGRVIEKKESFSVKVGVPIKDISVKYSAEQRQNLFDPDDVSLEILKHETEPSFIQKYEFGLNLFKSRAAKTDVKLVQGMGQNSFTSVELDNKFNFGLSRFFGEGVPPKLKDLTFDNSFNAKCIVHERGRLRMNDRIHLNMLRGFNKIGERHPALNKERHPRHAMPGFMHLGDHIGSRLAVRNTSKVIFNSYPFLKENANLKAFFHLTSVLTSEKRFSADLKDGLSMSAGIGVDMAYGPANIEFMYNFWHKKTKFDQRNFFQVKFAFGD
jgi:outer membrane protein assembly factor BamA